MSIDLNIFFHGCLNMWLNLSYPELLNTYLCLTKCLLLWIYSSVSYSGLFFLSWFASVILGFFHFLLKKTFEQKHEQCRSSMVCLQFRKFWASGTFELHNAPTIFVLFKHVAGAVLTSFWAQRGGNSLWWCQAPWAAHGHHAGSKQESPGLLSSPLLTSGKDSSAGGSKSVQWARLRSKEEFLRFILSKL